MRSLAARLPLNEFVKFSCFFENLVELFLDGTEYRAPLQEAQETLPSLKTLNLRFPFLSDWNYINRYVIDPQEILKKFKLFSNLQILDAEFALDLSSEQEVVKVKSVLKKVQSKLIFIVRSFDNFAMLEKELKNVFPLMNSSRQVEGVSSIYLALEEPSIVNE